MEKIINRTGEIHITNEGYKTKIIVYVNSSNATIQFESGLIIEGLQYSNIKRGKIKNPLHVSVQGVGFIGVGKYSKGTHPKVHDRWTKILYRSYCTDYHKTRPTYIDCSVDKRWHNFQNFTKWYEDNYVEDFNLDKDILFKGNKIYSPETCCFVPTHINVQFNKCRSVRGEYPVGVCFCNREKKFFASLGTLNKRLHLGYFNNTEQAFEAYKVAKEEYIKELANKWKSYITKSCYQALMNYKVEITD